MGKTSKKTSTCMNNFPMIRALNLMLKSYEICLHFCDPLPPFTRCYLISENVDNSGWPLRVILFEK